MDKKVSLNNPRVIIIQKLYSQNFNKNKEIEFKKNRYKKFIKDIVFGAIERKELIEKTIKKHLGEDVNMNRTETLLIIILHAAIFELLYRPQTPTIVIINEYLNSSKYFLEQSQTSFLNAILDKISRIIRYKSE